MLVTGKGKDMTPMWTHLVLEFLPVPWQENAHGEAVCQGEAQQGRPKEEKDANWKGRIGGEKG